MSVATTAGACAASLPVAASPASPASAARLALCIMWRENMKRYGRGDSEILYSDTWTHIWRSVSLDYLVV